MCGTDATAGAVQTTEQAAAFPVSSPPEHAWQSPPEDMPMADIAVIFDAMPLA
jgi:hypothetical protein